MDTSKEYIEMCEKVEEIQEEWKPKRGDFYIVVAHGKATDITDIYIDGFPCLAQRFIPLSELYIWLPRQDQLQGIYGSISRGYGLTWVFAEWLRDENTRMYIAEQKFNTQEQLWLIFIMWEKYNKTWDGEKWIKKT